MVGPNDTQDTWLESLRNGDLDDREIEVEVAVDGDNSGGARAGDSNQAAAAMLSMMNAGARPTEKRKMKIKDARPLIEEQELEKMMDVADVTKEAITAVENNGIVFIDEIDKICNNNDFRGSSSADASAEGVQRDLLPIIEGSTVNTKYGNVVTNHILFIASGAFHHSKPSNLLAELQGRLPIRVQLQGLTEDDMYRILTEPVANLIRQQVELMRTEGVDLSFEPEALKEIARVAVVANTTIDNIGARRLHSVLESIMEEISFDASAAEPGTKIVITADMVQGRVAQMLVSSDMSKHIL